MANATLVINDSENFCEDIWQYENDFKTKEWNEVKEEWIRILKLLYKIVGSESFDCFMEMFSKAKPSLYFGDTELYQLGDLINMLNSIDVKVKGE